MSVNQPPPVKNISRVLHGSGLTQGNLRQSSAGTGPSLPVEVEGLGVPGFHLWQLVADDLHQHRGELHFQGLGLAEGVEAELQQVTPQLQHREGT